MRLTRTGAVTPASPRRFGGVVQTPRSSCSPTGATRRHRLLRRGQWHPARRSRAPLLPTASPIRPSTPGAGPTVTCARSSCNPTARSSSAGRFLQLRRHGAQPDRAGSTWTAVSIAVRSVQSRQRPQRRRPGAAIRRKILVGIQHPTTDPFPRWPPNPVFRLNRGGPARSLVPDHGSGIEPASARSTRSCSDPDGDIVIGGRFDVVDGVARLSLARLLGRAPAASALDHFFFYKVKPTKGTSKLAPLGPLTLADALVTSDVDVQKLVGARAPRRHRAPPIRATR